MRHYIPLSVVQVDERSFIYSDWVMPYDGISCPIHPPYDPVPDDLGDWFQITGKVEWYAPRTRI